MKNYQSKAICTVAAIGLTLMVGCKKEEAVTNSTESQGTIEPSVAKPEPVTRPGPEGPRTIIPKSAEKKSPEFVVTKSLPIVIVNPEVSRDGQLAISQSPATMQVFRLSDGKMLLEPKNPGMPAVFSPDGRYVCCVYKRGQPTSFGQFRVFDLETGEKIAEIAGHDKLNQFIRLVFSPEGKYIYANTQYVTRRGIEKFDFNSRKSLWHIEEKSETYGFFHSTVFNTDPEDKWLFAQASRKELAVFSTADGSLVRKIGTPNSRSRFSEGRWLTMQEGDVEVFNSSDLSKLNKCELPARINFEGTENVYFTWMYWNTKNVLVGYRSTAVVFRDTFTGKIIAEYTVAPNIKIDHVVIMPDKETLMICSRTDTIFGILREK